MTSVDPARVLAALEALGWPDDRRHPEHSGALYDAAEEAIQAADRANRHGDLIDRLASCLASILAGVDQSDPNTWVGQFSNADIVGWRSLLVEYTCPCSLDKPWRCRSKGQPCPPPVVDPLPPDPQEQPGWANLSLKEKGRVKAAWFNAQGKDMCPVCLAPRLDGVCNWCPKPLPETIAELAIAYVNEPEENVDRISERYYELEAAVRHMQAVNASEAQP